jgi:hypothetical protein
LNWHNDEGFNRTTKGQAGCRALSRDEVPGGPLREFARYFAPATLTEQEQAFIAMELVPKSDASFDSLAPLFQLGPEFSEGTELGSLADEDGDFFFQGIGIVRRSAHIFDVLPESF